MVAPDRVAGIVLIGSKAAVRRDPNSRDQAVRVLIDDGVDAAFTACWRPLFGQQTAPEVLCAARESAVAIGAAWLADGVRAFHDRPDRAAALAATGVPILVINGDQDRPQAGAAMAATSRTASFAVMEDCGHYPPLERPHELARLIQQVIN